MLNALTVRAEGGIMQTKANEVPSSDLQRGERTVSTTDVTQLEKFNVANDIYRKVGDLPEIIKEELGNTGKFSTQDIELYANLVTSYLQITPILFKCKKCSISGDRFWAIKHVCGKSMVKREK